MSRENRFDFESCCETFLYREGSHVYLGNGFLNGGLKDYPVPIVDAEDFPVPIVHVEKYMFILVDDILQLLERAALEPLPPKDDKGPQNQMKVSYVNIML